MLAKRLIPVLLLEHGRVVESHQYVLTNAMHNTAAGALNAMSHEAADEIIVLDVSRDTANRQACYDAFWAIGGIASCPITAGGWITSESEAATLFNMGADKLAVNTAIKDNPTMVRRLAEKYGCQAIVASIDVLNGRWMVDRGRRDAGTVNDAVKASFDCGAGEILLTDISHEGTNKGYNLGLVHDVAEAANVPLLAFGGVARWEHLAAGLEAGADGVCLANVLHYSEHSVRKAKEFLKKRGAFVR